MSTIRLHKINSNLKFTKLNGVVFVKLKLFGNQVLLVFH